MHSLLEQATKGISSAKVIMQYISYTYFLKQMRQIGQSNERELKHIQSNKNKIRAPIHDNNFYFFYFFICQQVRKAKRKGQVCVF